MDDNISVIIFCKTCGKESEISNPHLFFNSDTKKCINCNSNIETGDAGIDEQLLLYLKKGLPLLRAVILCKAAKNMSLQNAKQYVEFLAKQNGVQIKAGVNSKTVMILAIAIAVLIAGIALFAAMLAIE